MGVQFLASPEGPLKVWGEPIAGEEYIIGVDVAEGKVRDLGHRTRVLDEIRSARDYSAALVIHKESADLVASWHASVDPYVLAQNVYMLGLWYNTALIAVEVTGPGRGVQANLTGWEYPNCWIPLQSHKVAPGIGEEPEYGWKTNAITRPLLIQAIHEHLEVARLRIPDADLLREMQTMEIDPKDGKPRGIGKNKDDRVFAFGIALRVRQESLVLERSDPVEDRYAHLSPEQRWLTRRAEELADESNQAVDSEEAVFHDGSDG